MSVQTEIDRIIGAVEAAHTAIAGKGGTTARPYLVGNLADAINTIPASVDPKLQAKTVSPSTSAQTVKPDSGYDALSQVTVNAMPTATQATPSISVSSDGLITASATQTAGYVAAGTKSATKQLTVQAAQTITPGTSNKTISSGRYLTGTQTIEGDSNLVADNIKSGVSIFGVAGSYAGSGGGSGGATLETTTVTVLGCYYAAYTGVENGAPVGKVSIGSSTNSDHTITVCRNSALVLGRTQKTYAELTNATALVQYSTYFFACNVTGESAKVNFKSAAGGGGGAN